MPETPTTAPATRTARVRVVRNGPHQTTAMLLIALLVTVCMNGRAYSQLYLAPPGPDWRMIHTPHFRITYAAEHEHLARRVADRAEAAWSILASEIRHVPRGQVDILVSDQRDYANGFAGIAPRNRIAILVAPPAGHLHLGRYDDWLDVLLIHELTHIFHLDGAGRVGRAIRRVLGRYSYIWPLFPAVGSPYWIIEGLAVANESRSPGSGRLNNSVQEMMLRTAVLEDRFPPIDRISVWGTQIWPEGRTPYLYGSRFMHYLAGRYGTETPSEIINASHSAVLPPALFPDRIGTRVTGQSFTASYRDFHRSLVERYAPLADSLRAAGLTESETLTHARNAFHPRISPDGRQLAFTSSDGRSDAGIRILDLVGGQVVFAGHNAGDHRASWIADSGMLLGSDHEWADFWTSSSHLYLLNPDSRRKRVAGPRLMNPDVSPDGRLAVALEQVPGSNRIVIVEMETFGNVPLTDVCPDIHWSLPRWDPSGSRIATARHASGRHDIVVLHLDGRLLLEVDVSAAFNLGPAWSPDGRYILFSSDVTGIPNLYAADLHGPCNPGGFPLYQITNLLTGAFHPEVAPDGRFIYFSGYSADGFSIRRMPFEPASWRPAGIATDGLAGPEVVDVHTNPDNAVDRSGGLTDPVPYRPFRTLAPTYWLPYYEDLGPPGRFIGAETSGSDLLEHHEYYADFSFNPQDRRFQWTLSTWHDFFRNPAIRFQVSRRWHHDGWLRIGDSHVERLEQEDVISAGAEFRRVRARSYAAASASVDGVFRAYSVHGYPDYPIRNRSDHLAGLTIRTWGSTVRRHALSISPEKGTYLGLTGRRRWDLNLLPWEREHAYWEVFGSGRTYRGFRVVGFANHAIALRTSGILRYGDGAPNSSLGGVPGTPADLALLEVGSEGRFLPVRGFEPGVMHGNRGWSASLEYRLPLLLPGRGYRLVPFLVNLLSASLFLDGGDIWCDPPGRRRSCPPASRGSGPDRRNAPLVSTGGEVSIDVVIGGEIPVRLRLGVAQPLKGPADKTAFYLATGNSF